MNKFNKAPTRSRGRDLTNRKSNAIIQTYIVVVLYKSKTPKIAFAVESGPQRLFFFILILLSS
jgi:hypothetical protein